MRIIAGEYRGFRLYTGRKGYIRPTTDFAKEVLFSTLGEIKQKIFLDLYAGSGSIGLEALSRGAGKVFFVESSLLSIGIIKKNIQKLGCSERCKIVKKKTKTFLNNTSDKFDYIFLDAPYNRGLVNDTLKDIQNSKVLNSGGKIIVEHSKKEELGKKLSIEKEKIIGDTKITILTF